MGQIARRLKEINKDYITIMGSKYATCYYKEIMTDPRLESIDYVILGDGEHTLLEMIQAVEHGDNLNNFVSEHRHIASKQSIQGKGPCTLEINDLPFPDRSMIKERNEFHAYICDSHGCCNQCSFCTQGNYYHRWNGRSAQSIYQEIKELHKSTNVVLFEFTGGSFEDPGRLGKQKIRELCEYVLNDKLKISMRCYLRANSFERNDKDIQLLHLMKEAGFNVVFVGYESGNNDDLLIYNKKTVVEQNLQMFSLLKDAGIYPGNFGFIMLNPYSTRESLKSNYRFLSTINSQYMHPYISKLKADNGTAIQKKIVEDGLMVEGDRLLNGVSYKYKNNEIEHLDRFITRYFMQGEVVNFIKNTDVIPSFINQLYRFIEPGETYVEMLNVLLQSYAQDMKDYFYVLYEQFDIDTCIRTYAEFLNEIKELDTRMVKLKQRFMRELIKKRIINNRGPENKLI